MASPKAGRHSEPCASVRVLVVGVSEPRYEWLARALVLDRGQAVDVLAERVPCLPTRPLRPWAAILLDARRPRAERIRLATRRVRDRARLLVDLRVTPSHEVLECAQTSEIAVLGWGTAACGEVFERELLSIVRHDPLVEHLEPVLRLICNDQQSELVTNFLRRSNMGAPHRVARALARAPRSLSRDCATLGLSTPQDLLVFARVSRGIDEVVHQRATVEEGARAAGYRHVSSFRRAARRVFDLSPSDVAGLWPNRTALAQCCRYAIFPHACE